MLQRISGRMGDRKGIEVEVNVVIYKSNPIGLEMSVLVPSRSLISTNKDAFVNNNKDHKELKDN